MQKVTVQNYNSFNYNELWEIIEWKDNCVYKTKRIGFMKTKNEDIVNKERFILCPLSTSLTKKLEFELSILERNDLILREVEK